MKKTLILALAICLVAGAFLGPAAAGKKKKKKKPARIEQVVEIAYTGGNLGVATPAATGGVCFPGGEAFACQSAVPNFPEAKYIKIEIEDASGLTVGGFISQGDTDGDTVADGYGQFCGAHPEPVELTVPGSTVDISIYAGICSDASGPSVITSGTITATFSNMP